MLSYPKFVNFSANLWKSCQPGILVRFQSTEAALLDLFQPGQAPKIDKEIVRDPVIQPKIERTEEKKKSDIIIKCARKELNHYRNQKYDKLKPIPLASKGWYHPKSKGDFFSIQVYDQNYDIASLFWEEDSSFQKFKLNELLLNAISAAGYEKPTKIQMEGIPVVLSGNNTIIAAETGCGKTLAFLLPILQQILEWKKLSKREPNSPLVLILTPSRELAVQIGNVARELCHHLPITCNTLTGGRMKQKMLNPDFRDIDLQISSLGAISKLTTTGIYNVSEVKHLVIDEADTMLDDSFSEHLLRYLRKFKIRYKPDRRVNPDGCQLTLVSATFPSNFNEILSDFVEPGSFEKVTSKSLHRFLPHVPQTFYRIGPTQKPAKLLHIAKSAVEKKQPTMIFSNKSSTCDWVSLMLHENGVKVVNLNGEMPLVVRMGQFEQFQKGEVGILSCTDIASRGLDTKHVKHVVNYDFPLYMADYIHRCGRTGRCGSSKDCEITNLVSGYREIELVQKIEMAIRSMEALPNVNGNITKIIRKRINKSLAT